MDRRLAFDHNLVDRLVDRRSHDQLVLQIALRRDKTRHLMLARNQTRRVENGLDRHLDRIRRPTHAGGQKSEARLEADMPNGAFGGSVGKGVWGQPFAGLGDERASPQTCIEASQHLHSHDSGAGTCQEQREAIHHKPRIGTGRHYRLAGTSSSQVQPLAGLGMGIGQLLARRDDGVAERKQLFDHRRDDRCVRGKGGNGHAALDSTKLVHRRVRCGFELGSHLPSPPLVWIHHLAGDTCSDLHSGPCCGDANGACANEHQGHFAHDRSRTQQPPAPVVNMESVCSILTVASLYHPVRTRLRRAAHIAETLPRFRIVMEPSNGESGEEQEPKARVQSVARGLAILLEVGESGDGLTAKKISNRLGLSRQTTCHLLHTLRATGFLVKGQDNRHQLGHAVGTLAEAFNRQLAPPAHLLPHARQVAEETGEPTYIAGWLRGEVAVLTSFPGGHAVRVSDLGVGTLGDAHARASGKVLLAFSPPDFRNEYLSSHPLTARTPNTLTDRAEFEAELERVRIDGYAIDREEFAEGICCISVPFDGGNSPYVMSLAAPKERFLDNADEYIKTMRRIAEESTWSVNLGSCNAGADSEAEQPSSLSHPIPPALTVRTAGRRCEGSQVSARVGQLRDRIPAGGDESVQAFRAVRRLPHLVQIEAGELFER